MKKVIIVLTLLSVFCSQVFAQRELLPKGKWVHYRQVVELGEMTQLHFVNSTTVISTSLKVYDQKKEPISTHFTIDTFAVSKKTGKLLLVYKGKGKQNQWYTLYLYR